MFLFTFSGQTRTFPLIGICCSLFAFPFALSLGILCNGNSSGFMENCVPQEIEKGALALSDFRHLVAGSTIKAKAFNFATHEAFYGGK